MTSASSTGLRSALVVVVPEAEPVVGAHREHLDAWAALDVPAHVTALFPFVPAEQALVATDRAGEAAARVPAFAATFGRTAWFGDDVLYLAPDDPTPFAALTEALHAAFPDHPPYGGAYDEPVPHLTVGHQRPLDELRAAERDVAPLLPVRATVDAVTLLVERTDGRWRAEASLPLGRPG